LIGIAGKNIFGNDAGRIGLARDSIRDIKTRVDIVARVGVTITT
jgi:hypothetical protein